MNCATSSALAPATINTCPRTAADCSTSGGPRPCWPSCRPHDPGLASSQFRRYLLARALTEPAQLITRCRCFGMWRRHAALALNGTAGVQASEKGPSSYTAQLPTPTGRSVQQGEFKAQAVKRLLDGGKGLSEVAGQSGEK